MILALNFWFDLALSFLFWYGFYKKKNLIYYRCYNVSDFTTVKYFTNKYNKYLFTKKYNYFTLEHIRVILYHFFILWLKDWYNYCSKEELLLKKSLNLSGKVSYYRYYCNRIRWEEIVKSIDAYKFYYTKNISPLIRDWFNRKIILKRMNRWEELRELMRLRIWREIIHPSFIFLHEGDILKMNTLLDRKSFEAENYHITLGHLIIRRFVHKSASYIVPYMFTRIVSKDHFERIRHWKAHPLNDSSYEADLNMEYSLIHKPLYVNIWNQSYHINNMACYLFYKSDRVYDEIQWSHFTRTKLKRFHNIEKKKLALDRPHLSPAFISSERHYYYWKILWVNWYNTIFHQIYFLHLADSKIILSDNLINDLLTLKGYFLKYWVTDMSLFKDFRHFEQILLINKVSFMTVPSPQPNHPEVRYKLPLKEKERGRLKEWSPFGVHYTRPYRWTMFNLMKYRRMQREKAYFESIKLGFSLKAKKVNMIWNEHTEQFELFI